MIATIGLMLGCLVAAIVCTVWAEQVRSSLPAWIALLACYGVCVGIVSSLLVHFFSLGPAAAILLAVPAGLPTLVFFARMSES